MSAGWPEPPGGDLGHSHHRRNQGPEGQFDLLPPRTPLGLLAAGHQLCTWLRVETRGGGRRPPVVLFHRYVGSLVPCGYLAQRYPQPILGQLCCCSALVPPLSPPGFGYSSQKLTNFTITLGPGCGCWWPYHCHQGQRPQQATVPPRRTLLGAFADLFRKEARSSGVGCTGPPLPPPCVAALAIGGRSCHVLLRLPCLQPCLFPLSPQTQSTGGPRLCPVCESTVPRTRHHIVGAHWTHEGASSRGLGSGLAGRPHVSFKCLHQQLPNLSFPGPNRQPYGLFLGFLPVDSLLVVASQCLPFPPSLQPLP